MLKNIKDSMDMTKGQRIGLIAVSIVMGVIITITALRPVKHINPIEDARIAKEFRAQIDSIKTDTIITPQRKASKKSKVQSNNQKSDYTLSDVPSIKD